MRGDGPSARAGDGALLSVVIEIRDRTQATGVRQAQASAGRFLAVGRAFPESWRYPVACRPPSRQTCVKSWLVGGRWTPDRGRKVGPEGADVRAGSAHLPGVQVPGFSRSCPFGPPKERLAATPVFVSERGGGGTSGPDALPHAPEEHPDVRNKGGKGGKGILMSAAPRRRPSCELSARKATAHPTGTGVPRRC